MSNHSSFVKLAGRLITKHGRSVTLYKLSSTVADASKPWSGAGTPTEIGGTTAQAVFLPHAGELELGKVVHDMELFHKAEQMVLIAPPASGVNLEDYHLLVDNTVRWRIEVIRTVRPGSQTILYVAGVCR